MKILKRIAKTLITEYIKGFRESAYMTYGHLYENK